MNALWVLGLLVVLVGAGVLVARRMPAVEQSVTSRDDDIPMWDADEHQQRDFWPELVAGQKSASRPGAPTAEEWRKRQLSSDETSEP